MSKLHDRDSLHKRSLNCLHKLTIKKFLRSLHLFVPITTQSDQYLFLTLYLAFVFSFASVLAKGTALENEFISTEIADASS